MQQKTIQQQQSFLEYIANKDRHGNLIITGVQEADKNEEDVTNILSTVAPDIQPLQYTDRRLGDPHKVRLPRPILIEISDGSKHKRNKICENSKIL